MEHLHLRLHKRFLKHFSSDFQAFLKRFNKILHLKRTYTGVFQAFTQAFFTSI